AGDGMAGGGAGEGAFRKFGLRLIRVVDRAVVDVVIHDDGPVLREPVEVVVPESAVDHGEGSTGGDPHDGREGPPAERDPEPVVSLLENRDQVAARENETVPRVETGEASRE